MHFSVFKSGHDEIRMPRGGSKSSRAAAGVDRWAGFKLSRVDQFGLATLDSERLFTSARPDLAVAESE